MLRMDDLIDELDLYGELAVPIDCPKTEIKKRYHILSKMYHPDNSETGDEDKFKIMKLAYDILSNKETRELYDKGTPISEILDREQKNSNDGFFTRVISLFDEAIDARGFVAEYNDVFGSILGLLNQKENNMEADIFGLEEDIAKLEEIKGRIKKGEIFIQHIDNLIEGKKSIIESIKEEKEMVDRIRGFVEKDCLYEVEEDKEGTDDYDVPPVSYMNPEEYR